MATSYTPSNIGSVTKDWVRWRVGDVNGEPQWFLQDEEIEALLGSMLFPDGSIRANEVLAQCFENIAAQCNQLANRVNQGDLRIQYGRRADLALKMAKQCRDDAGLPPGSPLEQGAVAGPIRQHALPAAYDALLGERPFIAHSPFDFEPY